MQSLADAWKERSTDPWTTKTLRQNSQPGVKAVAPPRQDLVAYVGPSSPVEPATVTAALLEALQGLCGQPSGKQEVSCESTRVMCDNLCAALCKLSGRQAPPLSAFWLP